MSMICTDDARRDRVRAKQNLNGLDYVEVEADATNGPSSGPATLTLYFLGRAPASLSAEHFRISGGQRVRDIHITQIRINRSEDPERDDTVELTTNRTGDFLTYTLTLSGIENIDPRYTQTTFTFHADCPRDLDCAPQDHCPPEPALEPDINYLARDYATFRQLIFDRLSLIMPGWQERHVPDIGVALVEVLAYTADYLSYYQDAVATEAYLDTARQRISVRRHARLVDYHLHEGCNARAWVCVEVDGDVSFDPETMFFVTGLNDHLSGAISGGAFSSETLRGVSPDLYEVFEPIRTQPVTLHPALNEIPFYTWGERYCCLPRGSTDAALLGDLPLTPGDVLIFEEVISPGTGNPADADPAHRHTVRLVEVVHDSDGLTEQPVTRIYWARADALPFALCLSALGPTPDCRFLGNISIARGNVILVDHGASVSQADEWSGVPVKHTQVECICAGHLGETRVVADRFTPTLTRTGLTFSTPWDGSAPAATAFDQDPRLALPQIALVSLLPTPDQMMGKINAATLWDRFDNDVALVSAFAQRGFDRRGYPSGLPLSLDLLHAYDTAVLVLAQAKKALQGDPENQQFKEARDAAVQQLNGGHQHLINEVAARRVAWETRFDVLASRGEDRHFVVEIDNDGIAHLRFGDGECGEQPEAGSLFYARYRTGNGVRGNVGAEAISHLAVRGGIVSGGVIRVRNPLAARGGIDPEPVEEAKLYAPFAFRRGKQALQRAITPQDYAHLAERNPAVQRAAAQLRWNGSWYEAKVAIDPLGGESLETQLDQTLTDDLYIYRRIGHDVTVGQADYVPVEIELRICVGPHHQRGHIKAALLEALGRRGFFNPDRFSFGDGVYLSQLVAVAGAVAGVQSVEVAQLHRQFQPPADELAKGLLSIGSFEIAQLDNDPNHPEHGLLRLTLSGGR